MSGARGEKKKRSYVSMLVFLLPKLIKAAPMLAVGINLVGIMHGMSHAFEMIVNRSLFDAITEAAGGGVAEGLLAPVLAFGALYVAKTALNGVHNFLWQPWYQKAVGAMNVLLSQKCARLDPVAFEDPALLDDINKAKEGVANAFALSSNFLTMLSFYLPFFVVSGSFLFSLKPLLLLMMLVMFAPAVLMLVIRTRLYARLEDRAAPLRRRTDAYEQAICGREFFKETRLFGGFAFLRRLYEDALLLRNKDVWRTEKKTVCIEFFLRLFMLSGYAGLLLLLFFYLLRGEVSVGAFAAVFASLGLVCSLIEEIVVRHMGDVAKDIGKVQNLVRFLQMPERGGADTPVDHAGSIELRHVTFRYPGADKDAVHDVSLTLHPGETLAIVGENGAGKTTLVRLLCGIFLPDSGQVLIGGQDTAGIAPEGLYENTSAVFQRVQRYQMTLAENVGISGEGGDVADALRQADVALDTSVFPEGLDTMLSRAFDGVDLSGGQWQRVSIARGLHRASQLILLDEPTAAIDPIEEANIYARFAEISRNKTAVIVTHRMGSVKIADRILVMREGRVDDVGTHDALIAKPGLYAQLWQAQAQWYA